MWKQFISSYLKFTKKERTGILFLLILIVLIMAFPFVYFFFVKPSSANYATFDKDVTLLKTTSKQKTYQHYKSENSDEEYQYSYSSPQEKVKYSAGALFYFNPNTLDEAGWKRLGVREKIITTIEKYLSKGGKFYRPEDIGKIWGFKKEEVDRLMPYVKIDYPQRATNYHQDNFVKKENNLSKVIDINTADTAAYIALPGIGSKLANRIIGFRNKLGGFYSVNQIAETYGLSDSIFQKIKPRLTVTESSVKKIDINKATLDEMKAHPYIRYYTANAIVQYRTQHGNFSSVNDLRKIMIITDDVFNKIVPYLMVN